MAVFTPVSDDDARELLTRYSLGELVSLRGITAGIENTNYFLTTTQGEYVLTLFEVLTYEQLPFYIELMYHLAQKGIPVPRPQTLCSGSRLTTMHGKPCAIVSRLSGGYEPAPSALHCALAGRTLAQAHLAGRDFSLAQPNLRGLGWWQQTVPKVLPFLNDAQARLIQDVLREQTEFAAGATYQALPFGPAHCDLFRDNVLFDGTFEMPRMGGIIDFYFAGCDTWIFDVAVSVNDWCIERNTGVLEDDKLRAWLDAYAQVRPFTDAEREAWPMMLQAAALRFWVSRLYDFFLPRPAQTLKPHDPRHFERILRERRKTATAHRL
ncbi:homoserine kinase [Parapusillimonas granuli]|uniref:Homoserine kinase n=1 Tax=Parapusillimonas granuli TaxID=380911 RepID=A0A853G2K4_9BURK|nr:homoserine kinase [Parapusillimonas granuli]MBB5214383.1 homoserine kinase type II [Parapusillimonas granuli]NYT51083.1 homoserine kinase [Parapusillimonas granuli]